MTIMINNVELECDFNDADFMEPFEKATQKMMDRSAALDQQKTSVADGIRKLCEIVNDYFDEIFGEGTSEKLFHGNHNQMDHLKAMEVIVEESNRAKKELSDFTNKYVQKQRSQQVQALKQQKSQQTAHMNAMMKG